MVWRASVREVILLRLDILQYTEKRDSRPDSKQFVELPNTLFHSHILLITKYIHEKKTKKTWNYGWPSMTGTVPKYNLIERKTSSGRIERRTEIVNDR